MGPVNGFGNKTDSLFPADNTQGAARMKIKVFQAEGLYPPKFVNKNVKGPFPLFREGLG